MYKRQGANKTQNQKAACHKDLRQSQKHTEDAESLIALYNLQHDKSGRHTVSKFRAIECKGPGNASIVNEKSEKCQKTLGELWKWHAHEELGVREDNPRRYQAKYLLEKAMAEKTQHHEAEDEFLEKFCDSDPEKKRQAQEMLEQIVHKRATS